MEMENFTLFDRLTSTRLLADQTSGAESVSRLSPVMKRREERRNPPQCKDWGGGGGGGGGR